MVIYLKADVAEREEEIQKYRSSIHCFPSKVVTTVGLGWEIFSRSPTLLAEAQALGPFSAAFPRLLTGSWMRNGASEVCTSAHIGCRCCSGQPWKVKAVKQKDQSSTAFFLHNMQSLELCWIKGRIPDISLGLPHAYQEHKYTGHSLLSPRCA